jgi:hypothetical protein
MPQRQQRTGVARQSGPGPDAAPHAAGDVVLEGRIQRRRRRRWRGPHAPHPAPPCAPPCRRPAGPSVGARLARKRRQRGRHRGRALHRRNMRGLGHAPPALRARNRIPQRLGTRPGASPHRHRPPAPGSAGASPRVDCGQVGRRDRLRRAGIAFRVRTAQHGAQAMRHRACAARPAVTQRATTGSTSGAHALCPHQRGTVAPGLAPAESPARYPPAPAAHPLRRLGRHGLRHHAADGDAGHMRLPPPPSASSSAQHASRASPSML